MTWIKHWIKHFSSYKGDCIGVGKVFLVLANLWTAENKSRSPDKSAIKKIFSFFNLTHVVGTQKNRLIEMVLLSTKNIGLN